MRAWASTLPTRFVGLLYISVSTQSDQTKSTVYARARENVARKTMLPSAEGRGVTEDKVEERMDGEVWNCTLAL